MLNNANVACLWRFEKQMFPQGEKQGATSMWRWIRCARLPLSRSLTHTCGRSSPLPKRQEEVSHTERLARGRRLSPAGGFQEGLTSDRMWAVSVWDEGFGAWPPCPFVCPPNPPGDDSGAALGPSVTPCLWCKRPEAWTCYNPHSKDLSHRTTSVSYRSHCIYQ